MKAESPVRARTSRLTFGRYDERFLEKSWQWLNDPEVKRLTMTPDFTREEQRRWFSCLPERPDYLIWGVSDAATPIGAVGLKNLTKTDAEYWGYIGERDHWGRGLGRELVEHIIHQAKRLGLTSLYLRVHGENIRAIRLYMSSGFRTSMDENGVLTMRLVIGDAHE